MAGLSQLRPNELIIDDSNYHLFADETVTVGGNVKAKGLVPRSLSEHPVGCFKGSKPFDVDFKEIPESEWADRAKEATENGSRLSDQRRRGVSNTGHIPSLDQNGQGYCWYYSTTMAVMMLRLKMNLPYVRLSAHAGACMIKEFRDEGGWCGLSMDRQVSHGTPSVQYWPEKSMSRSHNKPETWANAALHKVTEGWVDIASPVYDRNMTYKQVITLLLSGIPVAADFNWWGHSVCLLDVVVVESGSIGIRGVNSWTDGWGDKGEFVLRGDKAIPDSAVAPRALVASAA